MMGWISPGPRWSLARTATPGASLQVCPPQLHAMGRGRSFCMSHSINRRDQTANSVLVLDNGVPPSADRPRPRGVRDQRFPIPSAVALATQALEWIASPLLTLGSDWAAEGGADCFGGSV